jgi:hypothetical protein
MTKEWRRKNVLKTGNMNDTKQSKTKNKKQKTGTKNSVLDRT